MISKDLKTLQISGVSPAEDGTYEALPICAHCGEELAKWTCPNHEDVRWVQFRRGKKLEPAPLPITARFEHAKRQAELKGLEPVAFVVSRKIREEFISFCRAQGGAYGHTRGYTGELLYHGLPVIQSDSLKNEEGIYVAS